MIASAPPIRAAASRHGSPSSRPRAAGSSTRLTAVALACLAGMLILSPVQFLTLPLNMAPVEVWNALTLPILVLYLVGARPAVRLPYVGAFWLILIGSFIGTMAAIQPTASLIAILKDVYLYVTFVVLAAVLSGFGPATRQRFVRLWLAVVVVHGALIVAQFASPTVFQATEAFAARFGGLDPWRPSGLFENANSTALFQLAGFVPLVQARPSRTVGSLLGIFLLATIIATGSLAATAGFLVGLVVVLLSSTLDIETGRLARRAIADAALVALVLGALFYATVGRSPAFAAHFQYIFYGRATGSAEGRFSLWERGTELFASDTAIWGIGPDQYKDVDLLHKPLHNDLLAFVVERGIIGLVGLIAFAAMALNKCVRVWRDPARSPAVRALDLVFLAAIVGFMVHAQFHQIFHHRAVWLVLALLEGA